VLLRACANFSDCGFSRRVFLFRQEFSFSQSYRFFFPSFCQALAEDRVTTPTQKKKMCVFAAMGVTSTTFGWLEVDLSLSGRRGGKSHLGTILLSAVSGICRFCMVIRSLLPISMETTHDPKEPVLLIALKIMLHAKCLSVIIFLFACVGTQKGCAGHCLLVGRGGKFGLWLRV